MGWRRSARVRRSGPGRYAIELAVGERQALAGLAGQVRSVLEGSTDDPRVRRLFPTAYHDDPDRDLEYQLLTRDELLAGRLTALDALGGLDGVDELDEAGLSTVMRSLNDVRLVLGTILDVSEDEDLLPEGAPDADLRMLYHSLSALLDEIVDALTEGLGDAPVAPADPS